MTDNQDDELERLAAWIREQISSSGYVEVRPSFDDGLEESRIGWQDILYVLALCENVQRDFASGTYTIRGKTLDDELITIAVVISEPSEKNRIKILKAWKERKRVYYAEGL